MCVWKGVKNSSIHCSTPHPARTEGSLKKIAVFTGAVSATPRPNLPAGSSRGVRRFFLASFLGSWPRLRVLAVVLGGVREQEREASPPGVPDAHGDTRAGHHGQVLVAISSRGKQQSLSPRRIERESLGIKHGGAGRRIGR